MSTIEATVLLEVDDELVSDLEDPGRFRALAVKLQGGAKP